MATQYVSESELDAYLMAPDCEQCASEDVECIETRTDSLGGTFRTWYCLACGHIWTTYDPVA